MQNPSHQECYDSILNHLNLLYQTIFLYLKHTKRLASDSKKKTPDGNWLTSN